MIESSKKNRENYKMTKKPGLKFIRGLALLLAFKQLGTSCKLVTWKGGICFVLQKTLIHVTSLPFQVPRFFTSVAMEATLPVCTVSVQ